MADEAPVGARLYTRDEGRGPATVLLLHGVGSNHSVWNGVIPRLAAGFRVLAPDLRGHGRSKAPAGSRYTFEELANDLVELLSTNGVARSHVVGLSGGALLALRLALDRPDLVGSLTMVSGSLYTDPHTRAVAQRWAEVYTKEGPDPFALRLLKDLYYPDWIEGHLDFADQLRAQVKRQDFGPAAAWARALEAFDARPRIASLHVPTLIVQAMEDAVVDASHGRILRQSISGAKLRIFAETGHMIPVERPQETAEAIGEFVRAVEAGSTGTPSA